MVNPRQEVITLPLPPTLRQLLVSAGFRTTADLDGVGPLDLASGKVRRQATDHPPLAATRFCAELRISPEDALLVLKVANVHKDASLLGEWVRKL